MDNILEEKLRNFSALVMADARKKSDEITNAAEEKSKEILDENENKFLSSAYSAIQKSISKYSKEDNEKVLHAEVEAKKQILQKREDIIQRVFDETAGRLSEFINTDEYEKWMLKLAEKAFNEVGDGKKTVYITSQDLRFSNKIASISDDDISFEEVGKEGFIGGMRVLNNDRHVSVDYSFKELLEAQKGDFLQKAGLSIN